MEYLGNFRREGVEVTMFKCPVCNNSLTYLQSEYDEEGILDFYQCENCNKLIVISDNIEEEEL